MVIDPETVDSAEPQEDAETAETSKVTETPETSERQPSVEEENPTKEDSVPVEPLYDFSIGDSYIRNVPAGLTVKEFLGNLGFADGYENYSLSVIDSRGRTLTDGKTVKTGSILGVYKDGILIGTADIAVKGDWIKNRTGKDPRRPLIKVSTSGTRYYYTGRTRKPVVKSTYDGLGISSSSVRTKYSKGSIKPGNYKVSVTGKTYPGYATKQYSIIVKPSKIYSLKALNNGFKVQVYKYPKNYVTGYQLRYSTRSNMSQAKIKTIGTSYYKVSKNVTRLSNKKSYYVQVRSYKKIGSKKYYSSWSAKQRIKTR